MQWFHAFVCLKASTRRKAHWVKCSQDMCLGGPRRLHQRSTVLHGPSYMGALCTRASSHLRAGTGLAVGVSSGPSWQPQQHPQHLWRQHMALRLGLGSAVLQTQFYGRQGCAVVHFMPRSSYSTPDITAGCWVFVVVRQYAQGMHADEHSSDAPSMSTDVVASSGTLRRAWRAAMTAR